MRTRTLVVLMQVLLLLLGLLGCYAQTVQVEYHLGVGPTSALTSTFTFSRDGNTTTVTWQQFGAEANGTGVITSSPTDPYPSGFKMSNLYRGLLPMGLTRWTYIYLNKVATVQISEKHPIITVLPVDNATFAAGQFVTTRSGFVTFLNADVDLGGQPGTIGSLLATLGAEVATTIAASATTAFSTATSAANQHPNTALALGISIPIVFVFATLAIAF